MQMEQGSLRPASYTTQPEIRFADPTTTPSTTPQTEQKTQPGTSSQPAVSVATPAPAPARPLQSTVSDNIEFKLLKAEGNAKTQSITMTMVLTTTAASWYIMSSVKTIIDNDGNEYKLKSFTIGGVLPDVRFVKLFKLDYTDEFGQPFYVDLRDIPVDWRL